MIVHFVDIGGIVDHYCVNFLSTNKAMLLLKIEVITIKVYSCHHELVDHYKIYISQMAMDLFLFLTKICFFYSITDKNLTRIDYEQHGKCVMRNRN